MTGVRVVSLLLVLLALGGCGAVAARLTSPRPHPVPPRTTAPESTHPPAPTPVPAPGSVVAPPAAPAPMPAPPVPDRPPDRSAPPAVVLAPARSGDAERRLREETLRALDETERRLRRVAGRPLAPPQRDAFTLAQSLLEQGWRALAAGEYERAANLEGKARALAEELAPGR